MKVMRIDMIVFSYYKHDIKDFLNEVLYDKGIVYYPLKIELKSTDGGDDNMLLQKSTTPAMAFEFFEELNDRRTQIEKEIKTTETLLSDLKKELEIID